MDSSGKASEVEDRQGVAVDRWLHVVERKDLYVVEDRAVCVEVDVAEETSKEHILPAISSRRLTGVGGDEEEGHGETTSTSLGNRNPLRIAALQTSHTIAVALMGEMMIVFHGKLVVMEKVSGCYLQRHSSQDLHPGHTINNNSVVTITMNIMMIIMEEETRTLSATVLLMRMMAHIPVRVRIPLKPPVHSNFSRTVNRQVPAVEILEPLEEDQEIRV